MEQWCEIRQRVLRDGESIRQIQRETGLHFDTIKKILAHPTPPAFRTPVRVKPKLGPYLDGASLLHRHPLQFFAAIYTPFLGKSFTRLRT